MLRLLASRSQPVQLIRSFSSQSARLDPEIIEKYGRDVPVDVPRLKDVVRFPVPPLHYDYENVWRRATAWACKYIDRQEDLILLANMDLAYSLGFLVPHCTSDAYLAVLKALVCLVYIDTYYDNRFTHEQKVRAGQMFLTRFQTKKYPKDCDPQFKAGSEMVIDFYRDLRRWLDDQQVKQLKENIMKFAAAEMLTPKNKTDHQVDVNKYVKYRTITSLSPCAQPVCEAISGFRMPEELKKHPDIERIYVLCNYFMLMSNDLASFKIEQIRDDHWNNFITVYARQNLVTLQDSVDKLIQTLDDMVVENQRLMHQIVNSNLVIEYPGLKDFLEIGFANCVYGCLQMHSVLGKYNGGTVIYEKEPKRNDRIDPNELYARISIGDGN